MTITKPNIILVGGTGLIGQQVIKHLSNHPKWCGTLYAPTRRSIGSQSTDFLVSLSNDEFFTLDHLDATLGIICLGTTKKQAGSNEGLYQIDHDLVLRFAKKMKALGVQRLAVVSSLGANPNAWSHYLKCKGEMERDVHLLEFEHIIFARPGPLVGKRAIPRVDETVLQNIMKVIRPLMLGPLHNLRPIHAQDVAQFLVSSVCAKHTLPSITIATYQQLIQSKV
ncbi:NAD-dependent epimerase/dehydratase family protein [Vibrio ezurae]|uniref:NAD(P)-binding domain-containing protein n=1 Tax=Vibrio ezurae NBRC 102218 TaxID=1219080 RepID=U3AHV2_9VIBR|nr:NAD-dependent epimerase/dehydratase family protein [Vibrio ezurae]GAD79506.1 hypothetical protein VEZ01S_16_00550 [Vibrio ezurae NBRC 102218]